MIERATGLVLRTRPLTETSLIVLWLTTEYGRIATVAKGARRSKSPFRGKIDLFYLADFSFNRSRKSELHTLSEVSLRETNVALRRDYDYLSQASYCAALIEQSTETETELPGLLELLTGMIRYLPSHPPGPLAVLGFELKLLAALGLSPSLEDSKLTPGARRLIEWLQENDWEGIARLKPTGAQLNELRQFLHGFLIFHLGRIPKGRGRCFGDR
jgi:DNA repair protein RecO (recombination protein O)